PEGIGGGHQVAGAAGLLRQLRVGRLLDGVRPAAVEEQDQRGGPVRPVGGGHGQPVGAGGAGHVQALDHVAERGRGGRPGGGPARGGGGGGGRRARRAAGGERGQRGDGQDRSQRSGDGPAGEVGSYE